MALTRRHFFYGSLLAGPIPSAGFGSTLVLAGRRPEPLHETARLVRERGGSAFVIPADLSEPDAPARLLEQAIAALGGLDLLINGLKARIDIRT